MEDESAGGGDASSSPSKASKAEDTDQKMENSFDGAGDYHGQ